MRLSNILFASAVIQTVCGQTPPSSLSVTSLGLRPGSSPAQAAPSPSAFVMTKNRARTLGDELSASQTRYFAVTDADLQGRTNDEILRRLMPKEVKANDGVRRMEILIDVRRPVTVTASAPTYIGTASIDAATRRIEVNSTITVTGLKVVRKK